jgi:hypothetical protein
MSYVVTKTVKGRQYRYLQTSWRDGSRVRTRSVYLGAVDGNTKRRAGVLSKLADFVNAQRLSPEDRAMVSAEKQSARIEREQREIFGETAQERSARETQEHLDTLHDLYGLTVGSSTPTEIDKTAAATQAAEAPAVDSSQADPEAE